MKIKKVFSYMGNKGRFYKEIKEIFLNSKKGTFVDLFAGGLEVPLNLHYDLGIEVLANVKDSKMECIINNKDKVLNIFLNAVKEVYGNMELKSTRKIYTEDRKTFDVLKKKFIKVLDSSESDERDILMQIGSVGGKNKSLSSNFYTAEKIEKLKNYLEEMKKIKIMTEYFNEKWKFSDSFIFLDPPYLLDTKAEANTKGYNYNIKWTESDDKRLIEFIKRNMNKNNVFMVFGSLNNNLHELIEKEFRNVKFEVKRYKKSFFGSKSTERAEWYCLIK